MTTTDERPRTVWDLRISHPEWAHASACRLSDPEDWQLATRTDPGTREANQRARRTCWECPVRRDCLITAARGRLHALVCASTWWSDDCRRPDGGRHARDTWPAPRIRALADDPADLHAQLCFAALQAYATKNPGYACLRPVEHATALHGLVFAETALVTWQPDLLAELTAREAS